MSLSLSDGKYFPIICSYRLSENVNVAILLCQNQLIPAYAQMQLLLQMESQAWSQADLIETYVKAFGRAVLMLDVCIGNIGPLVDRRYLTVTRRPTPPTRRNSWEIEMLVITIGNICLSVIDLILDVLIEISRKRDDHYRLYHYLPRMFNSKLDVLINNHVYFMLAFAKDAQSQMSEPFKKLARADLNTLFDKVRKVILLIPAQLNAFVWAKQPTSVYYFNAFDFSLTVAQNVIDVLIDTLFVVFTENWARITIDRNVPIYTTYKKELKEQVITLIRYFRLRITAKMHRPLGFIAATYLKAELMRYKETDNPENNGEHFRLVLKYKKEMKAQSQSTIFQYLRKFIYNLVLHDHVKAENLRFQNDLLGLLMVGREMADLIVTLIFSKEDIACLFEWSQVMLVLACRSMQKFDSRLSGDIRKSIEQSQPELFGKLSAIYTRLRGDITLANYYDPPKFFERPFAWEKVYSLPREVLVPGYDHDKPKVWFLSTIPELWKDSLLNR